MKNLKLLVIGLISTLAEPALAQTGMFTSLEIQKHRENIEIITETAAQCLEDTYEDHENFHAKWGVSKYYGDRKPEHKTPEGRTAALRKYGAPTSLLKELQPISCIGLTVKCLGKGFERANLGSTWQKIFTQLKKDNKMYGTDLQIMLRQLGWKTMYWNPDPSQNKAWDAEDLKINPLAPGKKWNPVWGGHAYRYSLVLKKNDYYNIPIDDAKTLVGFKTSVPSAFVRAPFFVGTAHAGYHVFPGYNGKVIEAHSMRELNSKENLEVSDFNPLAQSAGGGPRWTRSERYRSGVIVVPPSR